MTQTEMLLEIFRRAPTYVWAILAVIVVFGLLQMRTRTIKRTNMLIMPLAMLGFSAYSAVRTFGLDRTLGAWFAGIGIALAVNGALLKMPFGASYDRTTDTVAMPGSAAPLVIMLAIFATNFALGVAGAIAPLRLSDPSVRWFAVLWLGFLSGLFIARAMRAMKRSRSDIQHSELRSGFAA